jgi:hypothetical protein
MKLEAMVVGERPNSYDSKKRGPVTERILMLQDLDERKTFVNTVDFVLPEEDAKRYSKEDLLGKRVTIHFGQMRVDFGGRFKLLGELLPLNGAKANPAAK